MSDHPRSNPDWEQHIRDDWYQHIPPPKPTVDGPPQITAHAAPAEDFLAVTAAQIDQLLDMKDFHGVAGERVLGAAVEFLRGRYRARRDRAWNK